MVVSVVVVVVLLGPLNPTKTGIKGRGILGKKGPNHAADPVITRYCIAPLWKTKNRKTTRTPACPRPQSLCAMSCYETGDAECVSHLRARVLKVCVP